MGTKRIGWYFRGMGTWLPNAFYTKLQHDYRLDILGIYREFVCQLLPRVNTRIVEKLGSGYCQTVFYVIENLPDVSRYREGFDGGVLEFHAACLEEVLQILSMELCGLAKKKFSLSGNLSLIGGHILRFSKGAPVDIAGHFKFVGWK